MVKENSEIDTDSFTYHRSKNEIILTKTLLNKKIKKQIKFFMGFAAN